jgi:hypothetical protein
LIIVMALVVLLSGMIIAFFSQATQDRKIANTSSKFSVTDLFAQGAVETLLGDLKEEIAAGSSEFPFANKAATYLPRSEEAVVPSLSGIDSGSTLENLVKVSRHGTSFFSGKGFSSSNPPNRASSLSTSTPSLNGRSIGLSRWNLHYLLEKATATQDLDPTPAAPFRSPDWILVDRAGKNPNSGSGEPLHFGKTGNTLNNQHPSNPSFVVGRYAYAIYHEGGLLDLNVAGYPPEVGAQTLLETAASYKPNATYADLQQLPGLKSLSPGRRKDVIEQLVGWRNYASAKPSGAFPDLSFSAMGEENVKNYIHGMMFNPSGFLHTVNTSVVSDRTDRLFASRRQLIEFLLQGVARDPSERAALQEFLQYVTTFSRSLDQPSYVPPVNNPAATNPPKVVDGTGGNSAFGNDEGINPAFLNVRVQNSFVRTDGSVAQIGDPLVSKRFPLDHLAWITYKGPSATIDSNDPLIQALITQYGYTLDFLQRGTAENIYRYFGLSWVKDTRTMPVGDGQEKWVYNHTSPSPFTSFPSGGSIISRLTNVSGRDPDYFELLKAGVACGSKAKAATIPTAGPATVTPNTSAIDGASPTYNYNQDSSLELAILQMGANIIDQSDLDAFSTRILFDDGSLLPKEIRGVENFPYLYQVRHGMVQGASPTVNAAPPLLLASTGFNVIYKQPSVWNPHDQNSPVTDPSATALQPSQFRVVAYSTDPDHINNSSDSVSTTYSTVVCGVRMASAPGTNPNVYYNNTPSYQAPEYADTTTPIASPFSGAYNSTTAFYTCARVAGAYPGGFRLAPENSALYFNVPNTGAFREPTLLISPNIPAGSNLSAVPPAGLPAGKSMLNPNVALGATVPSNHPNIKPFLNTQTGALTSSVAVAPQNTGFLGFYMMTLPANWHVQTAGVPTGSAAYVAPASRTPANPGVALAIKLPSTGAGTASSNVMYLNHGVSSTLALTYRMQYLDPSTQKWVTYDEKYSTIVPGSANSAETAVNNFPNGYGTQSSNVYDGMIGQNFTVAVDPRTSRFGMGYNYTATTGNLGTTGAPVNDPGKLPLNYGWISQANNILMTQRPEYSSGFYSTTVGTPGTMTSVITPQAGGWYPRNMTYFFPGLLSQNSSTLTINGKRVSSDLRNTVTTPNYYTDPDGVVRRAMGAYASGTTLNGLPLATATSAASAATQQVQSRPILLNRPFKSVGELGYVFSGTPWKNIDFFTPESGDAGLLDLFCLTESETANAMVAGKVNLNTRQVPVLKAILKGAYRDEQSTYSGAPSWKVSALTEDEAQTIAQALVTRTTSSLEGKGPLTNVSDLVGKFVSGSNNQYVFDGFSNDLTDIFGANTSSSNIQRLREAPIRALAASGQTRVWNLMIDLVAQVGRYPVIASKLDQFQVEGEQHYWVHVAIDRYTGEIIDQSMEVIKE